jgi:hypothetical protein
VIACPPQESLTCAPRAPFLGLFVCVSVAHIYFVLYTNKVIGLQGGKNKNKKKLKKTEEEYNSISSVFDKFPDEYGV